MSIRSLKKKSRRRWDEGDKGGKEVDGEWTIKQEELCYHALHLLLRHNKCDQDIKRLPNNPFLIFSIYSQIKPSDDIISLLVSNFKEGIFKGERFCVIRSNTNKALALFL